MRVQHILNNVNQSSINKDYVDISLIIEELLGFELSEYTSDHNITSFWYKSFDGGMYGVKVYYIQTDIPVAISVRTHSRGDEIFYFIEENKSVLEEEIFDFLLKQGNSKYMQKISRSDDIVLPDYFAE